jgi:adenine-specific DNA-methyltransferase
MSLEKITRGDEQTKSLDLVNDNINKLRELFPEIITEGKIDFKALQEILGEELEEGEEFYRFTWAGKAQARREAHKPSTGTLRPCKEESVDWDATQNLYIEGDNLEVLKLLQKSYANKVKMIYIDPPYNTGKDFVYKDNYKDNLKNYQQVTGQVDDEGNKLSTNSDSDGRYHSNWLNMMYPRLRLARNLLKKDGVIFISIDDNEIENLIKISNEIFGESSHLATFIWNTDGHTDNQLEVKVNHEYIVCYKKEISKGVLNPVIDPNTREDSNLWKGYAENSITKNGPKNPPSEILLKKGFPCKVDNLILDKTNVSEEFYSDISRIKHISREITKKYGCSYPIRIDPIIVKDGKLEKDCRVFAGWANNGKLLKFIENGFQPLIEEDGLITFYLSENGVIYYHKERDAAKNILSVLRNFKTTEKMRSELEEDGIYFTYPKPNDLLQYLCGMTLSENDIMLDFFSGSASSADALLKHNSDNISNSRFIQIQLQETTPEGSLARENGFNKITEIGKERIRRAVNKIAEENPEKAKDLDLGFKVFKLDSSNIKGWDGNPEDIEASLFDAQENIKTDRTEEDVLFEILLKYGLDLTLPIDEKIMDGKKVFSVGFGALFICLADDITNKVAEAIGAWKQELNPATCRVIFKDSGFTDVEKANAVQTLKRFGISEIKSI